MKTVLAFDSFKGSLSAREVCEAVRDGILSARPGARIAVCPMADGGEGTAEALLAASGGEWIPRTVTGPLPEMRVEAGFVWLEQERVAVVEMARASGLPLLRPEQYAPLRTTTFGTGELIRAASEKGARRILLAVGGSATVDGGTGAAQALGWRFLPDGSIIPPEHPELPEIEVLCDVTNPLCGPDGAARVYGPQKGADPAMVEVLDRRLSELADQVAALTGRDVREIPGAGAAGGLAFGAMVFLDGKIVSGVDKIIETAGLPAALAGADWVFTGEGRFDFQSLRGKVADGVLRTARAAGVNAGVIAGCVQMPEAQWRAAGFSAAVSLQKPGMSAGESIRRCGRLLAEAGALLARDLAL